MKATWEEISGAARLRPSLDHALDVAFMTFGAVPTRKVLGALGVQLVAKVTIMQFDLLEAQACADWTSSQFCFGPTPAPSNASRLVSSLPAINSRKKPREMRGFFCFNGRASEPTESVSIRLDQLRLRSDPACSRRCSWV